MEWNEMEEMRGCCSKKETERIMRKQTRGCDLSDVSNCHVVAVPRPEREAVITAAWGRRVASALISSDGAVSPG